MTNEGLITVMGPETLPWMVQSMVTHAVVSGA